MLTAGHFSGAVLASPQVLELDASKTLTLGNVVVRTRTGHLLQEAQAASSWAATFWS